MEYWNWKHEQGKKTVLHGYSGTFLALLTHSIQQGHFWPINYLFSLINLCIFYTLKCCFDFFYVEQDANFTLMLRPWKMKK